MTPRSPDTYRALAEASWRWVLDQVQWDDGPWIPTSVTVPLVADAPEDRDGMHSGIGGLALGLAEIRLSRHWTAQETELAEGITDRIRSVIPAETNCTYFDGLASAVGVLTALDTVGVEAAVDRLNALATSDGWPQAVLEPPRFLPGARFNDLTLGTAGVLLAALWARRQGAGNAHELAEHAARVLMAEKEELPTGTNWRFVPQRFRSEPGIEMPNLSHGLAGIAATLALAGAELDRADLTAAARSGAEHLVTLGDPAGLGFVVPSFIPKGPADLDEVTYTWCHGPTGTSLLFLALEYGDVADVAGEPPLSWHRRCLHSVRTSGVPERRYPGFWDNDGRCCGSAGVGDVFLDSWQRARDDGDLEFALHLADTVVERAVVEGSHAYWQFVEHRAPDPLLPPGVGWMQGAAGIAAFLFRASRVMQDGLEADAAPRMDNWWALPLGRTP